MRKWLAVMLAALLMLSLTACGGCSGDPEPGASSAPEISAPNSVGVSDVSDPTSDSSNPTATTTGGTKTTSSAPSNGKTTRSKVSITTTTTTTSETTTTTRKVSPPKDGLGFTVDGVKNILCWGDSITAGMGMATKDAYPSVLQTKLGDGYKVWNGGNSGDGSYAIMARQGALSVTTKEDITFDAGVSEVKIGHNKQTYNLMLSNGKELTKLNIQENIASTNTSKLRMNPLTIMGKSFNFKYHYEGEVSEGYNILLTRVDNTSALTIPAGTAVTLSNANKSDTSYCEIIHMGANDSISSEANSALVSRYQAMIDRMPHDCWLVIVPYWCAGRYDSAFKEAFGDRAINVIEEISKRGLSELGLEMTDEDLNMLKKKRMPVSLQYHTRDGCHLNKYGYQMLATLVYERGKQLKYWN